MSRDREGALGVALAATFDELDAAAIGVDGLAASVKVGTLEA